MDACKTIAKVFFIISIVLGALGILGCICGGVTLLAIGGNEQMLQELFDKLKVEDPKLTMEVLQVTLKTAAVICFASSATCVVMIVVSAIGNYQLNHLTKHGQHLVIGILSIVFGAVVAGILTIVYTCMIPQETKETVAQ